MLNPRVIVFDLDNTLMDHTASSREGLAAWVTSFGRGMTDELAAAWAAAEKRHFTDWKNGNISFAEQRRRRLRDVLPLMGEPAGSDSDLDAVFAGYLQAYESAWQPYADVKPCLQALHDAGQRMAVLTNGSEDQQRKKLRLIGVIDFFESVFTAEGLGVCKPDRAAYELVAGALDVAPGECLNVGDDYEMDVLGPRAAGWSAVHLDRTNQHRGHGVISTLDILPLLVC